MSTPAVVVTILAGCVAVALLVTTLDLGLWGSILIGVTGAALGTWGKRQLD